MEQTNVMKPRRRKIEMEAPAKTSHQPHPSQSIPIKAQKVTCPMIRNHNTKTSKLSYPNCLFSSFRPLKPVTTHRRTLARLSGQSALTTGRSQPLFLKEHSIPGLNSKQTIRNKKQSPENYSNFMTPDP